MNGSFFRLDDSWIGKTVLYGHQITNKPAHCKTCNCTNYQLELIPATIIGYHKPMSEDWGGVYQADLRLSKEILINGYKTTELKYITEACWKSNAAYSWVHPDCK